MNVVGIFMAIRSILRPRGIFVAIWYVYFVAIWFMYFVAIGYILWPFGLFYGHVVFLWPFGICILWPFGISCGHLVYIFPVLVCCTKENLATR
jgi:hypothetical protein